MARLAHDRKIDDERLGGVLVIGAAIILAIRTARREPIYDVRGSNRDWGAEIDFALELTKRILGHATSEHAEMFRQTIVKFTEEVVADDEME